MPLFFQQAIHAHTQLAIWKITEEEAFFLPHVPLQRTITHPHKRLQHLAGRYLLKYLFPAFPLELILLADTRKPYLENELFHFSISHCGDFAAVIVSTQKRVGVDVELVHEKIERIRHKFISDPEIKLFDGISADTGSQPLTVMHQLTLAWSCKEALFKWYGAGNVDFKNHMQLQHTKMLETQLFQTSILFKKEQDRLLMLRSCFFDSLCLSYIVT